MRRIISIIIFLIIGLVTYKFVMLNIYHVDEIKLYTDNIFNDTITIQSKETNDKLFTYEKLSMRNDFSDYIRKETYYVKYNDDYEVISSITISKMPQYYLLLHDNSLLINNQEKIKSFNEDDLKTLIKEKNINNDIQLFNYIKDNYYLNSNIFDTFKKIKQNYIINAFVETQIFSSNDENTNTMTLINGDLTGYIIYAADSAREIHLLYNDEQYIITLIGDELIEDDYIISLLETVKFN